MFKKQTHDWNCLFVVTLYNIFKLVHFLLEIKFSGSYISFGFRNKEINQCQKN